jgi:hypothetical protein
VRKPMIILKARRGRLARKLSLTGEILVPVVSMGQKYFFKYAIKSIEG